MEIILKIDDKEQASFLKKFNVRTSQRLILTRVNGSGKTLLLNAIQSGQAKIQIDGEILSTLRILTIDLSNINWISINNDTQYPGSNNIQYPGTRRGMDLVAHKWQSFQMDYNKLLELTDEKTDARIVRFLKEAAGYSSEDIFNLKDASSVENLSMELIDHTVLTRYTSVSRQFYVDSVARKYVASMVQKKIHSMKSDFVKHNIPFSLEKSEFDSIDDPISKLNVILNTLNMPYHFKSLEEEINTDASKALGLTTINSIENTTLNQGASILRLINSDGIEVPLASLSSGEKYLLGIGGEMYGKLHNTEGPSTHPLVVLIDEPDARLHPANISFMIDMIEKIFQDIFVIITSHSPTTIALAENYTIAEMEKGSIRLIDRELAISRLMRGAKGVNVQMAKNRDIFVEGKSDVQVFTSIFNTLKRQFENRYFDLNFVYAGSKEKVGALTKALEQARGETRTIIGVTDWDNGNNPQDNTTVFAMNERYAMENALYDPLVILFHLIRKRHSWVRDNLGSDVIATVLLQQNNEIQVLIDKLIRTIKGFESLNLQETSIVEYGENLQIAIPNTLLTMEAHSYEKAWGHGPGNLFGDRMKFDLNNLPEDYKAKERASILETMDLYPKIIPNVFGQLFLSLLE